MAAANDLEKSVKRLGITEIYTPTGSGQVDIVFIHGLSGHPYRTWTSRKNNVFWPHQLLPAVVKKNAQILVYGYDPGVTSLANTTLKLMSDYAEDLIDELHENRSRRNAARRPIVFIAHSLGGFIVKQALACPIHPDNPRFVSQRSILNSTYGVMFLGSPHKETANPLNVISPSLLPPSIRPGSVEGQKSDSGLLSELHLQFMEYSKNFLMDDFGEAKSANPPQRVVDGQYASVSAQEANWTSGELDQDHLNDCKFESSSSPGFDLLSAAIQRSIAEAPDMIRTRWKEVSEEASGKSAYAGSTTGLEQRANTRRRPLNVDDTNNIPHQPSHAQPPENILDTFNNNPPTAAIPGTLRFVPVYTRRGDGELAVWVPEAISLSSSSASTLSEVWAWYLNSGVGFATLVASLITALYLNYISKKGLSTSFGVATWVLVAGTLLAGTLKACLGERPRLRPPMGHS